MPVYLLTNDDENVVIRENLHGESLVSVSSRPFEIFKTYDLLYSNFDLGGIKFSSFNISRRQSIR